MDGTEANPMRFRPGTSDAEAKQDAGSSLPPAGGFPGGLHAMFLAGEAGRLEAVLNEGSLDAGYCALVCHPHPMGGGTMHNKVVYHAAKVFAGMGVPVLRFNFRGVGLSAGTHDGRAEGKDVEAAVNWLDARYRMPVVAAGFSFGAAMGLGACCGDQRVAGFAALGLPTRAEGREYHYRFLQECGLPKLVLSGDRDQYAPVEELRAIVAAAAMPVELRLIAGADHFFTGHLGAMQAELGAWVERLAATRPAEGYPG